MLQVQADLFFYQAQVHATACNLRLLLGDCKAT